MYTGPGLTRSGTETPHPASQTPATWVVHAGSFAESLPCAGSAMDPRCYMSMVLRIRPTARPSISKGSPGCTVITG